MGPEPIEVEFRDEHLEPLRRFLGGDIGGLEPFDANPDNPDVEAARLLMLTAAMIGIQKRFGNPFYRREIIRFVADLRISHGKNAEILDPRVLEELILVALGTVHPNDIHHSTNDPDVAVTAQMLILGKLRDENVIPPEEVDEFTQEVMAFARQMLEVQRALVAGTFSL
ncbi:hypothetical protein [Actinomadura sp. SCN-SB]|uniref:hypothetical protein n=1 Tax=Actinomadura sp. SCN-SB TaxID=3373092 RepID=UPI003750E325